MKATEVIAILKAHANPLNVEGMVRFGINSDNLLGISIPFLRQLAKEIGKDHDMAQQLWESGIHEARILAAFVDKPEWVTEEQMEAWVADFDSWDVCDQVCGNLFDKTPWAYEKALAWAEREEEFVRRAGFAIMAMLAVHDKKATDEQLAQFFALIMRYATDERNFVKKAVNWALRQIGKRNPELGKVALSVAEELAMSPHATARWVGKDAVREFYKKHL